MDYASRIRAKLRDSKQCSRRSSEMRHGLLRMSLCLLGLALLYGLLKAVGHE
jgi:hypothetical protein